MLVGLRVPSWAMRSTLVSPASPSVDAGTSHVSCRFAGLCVRVRAAMCDANMAVFRCTCGSRAEGGGQKAAWQHGNASRLAEHKVDDMPRHGLPRRLPAEVVVRSLHKYELAVGHQRGAQLRVLKGRVQGSSQQHCISMRSPYSTALCSRRLHPPPAQHCPPRPAWLQASNM